MGEPRAVGEYRVERPHSLPVGEVETALATRTAGLSSDAAAGRLREVGPNLLPEPRRTHPILRFLAHFNDTLIYILLGAAVIKAIMADWLEFWVIMAVAIINAVIGFVQEFRAGKAIEALARMVPENTTVLRGGEKLSRPAAELVPGDVVELTAGDKVPADMRLLAERNLQIEEASLTGESVPVHKRLAPVAEDTVLGDRTSLVFGGKDLRDLYVVTDGDYRKPQSRNGRIYRARSDVAGQKTPKVSF